ncbi:MAG TPA: family 78 glycoside hydrolase catalytic domain [Terriglobia bacterium]|nr:family 78 glycoside hydrolase catalytic domain [Terriglobia bacterium]
MHADKISLRFVLISITVLIAGLLFITSDFAQNGIGAPGHLRCEYLSNPTGIDVRQPRFQWVLDNSGRGVMQTAYQVLVASSPANLAKDRGDVWDSGKVASGDSTQVVYNGKPLESGHIYWWKVRTWDSRGKSSLYSLPAKFGMGLLERADWMGQWIGGEGLLRKEFGLPGKVVRARAYVTALGYYELHINGKKIGNKVLDPAWTVYPKRVLYSTYDATSDLKDGANAIGVMLGGGWATQEAGGSAYYKTPALLFQMNIEMADGKTVSVSSDTSWKTTAGPVVSDSVYDGEVYDARLGKPGWDRPGFNDAAWASARQEQGTAGAISAEMMPPIRVTDTLVPRSMTNPERGVYVYDFGQNFAGWAQLRVRGPRGTKVRLRFSELIYPDGTINRQNLRSAKARDIYILKGSGLEEYEPRFTYHGFRYVELTGYPGTPSLDSIRGRVVNSDVRATGNFVASKEILNQIQHLIRWGQLSNLYSIPTDCDQRNERQGWMGDAQVSAEEAMMNFDMAAFYTNFVRDIRDAQKPDGEIPDTVPHKYGQYPADPAWGTAYSLICWYMWQQYGDKRILQENYEGLQKYEEFLRSRARDNVLRYSYYGDWIAIKHTPGALVSDSYFYYDTRILSEIAKVLGKTGDTDAYAALADQIKDAFNKAFFNAETGEYANGTQTAQAMPLFLDLVPQKERGGVMGKLYNNIVYEHNTHLTTGFIGVKYLLPVLTRDGQNDVAYELATQTSYPSWGYMISKGATTLWELWQDKIGPSMNSHDHIMLGSIGSWFYRALGGINLGPDGEGYRHILIEPRLVEDLHWASASVETVRGNVSCSWNHRPGSIAMEITIPGNSDARVVVPEEEDMTTVTVTEGDHLVWQNGKFVPGDPGITGATSGEHSIEFSTGSGYYHFLLTGE